MKRLFLTTGAVLAFCGCHVPEDESTVLPADEAAAPLLEEQRAVIEGLEVARAAPASPCAAGALDSRFGAAGTARFSIGSDDSGGFFALSLRGPNIVAAGYGAGGLGGTDFQIARIRSDGTPDPAFEGGELVQTRWETTQNGVLPRAVGHQRDGRIVAIGELERGPRKDVVLARYDTDGTLDIPTFGGDGKPLLDLGGAEEIGGGLVAADDAILAVGSRDDKLLVARFTPNGALDTSFAGGVGYFTAALGESSRAAAVALDDRNRIVVAGSARVGGQLDVLAMRLTSDGAVDTSFGDGGHVLAGAPTVDERAVAVAVDHSGRIVVAGDSGSDARDFLVRRFLASGAPDSGFGDGGAVSAAITDGDDQAEGMALVPAGSILVVGNSSGGDSPGGPVVVRYTAAGALDPAFGTGGVLPLYMGDSGVIHTVAMDSSGMALLGGGDEGGSPGPGTFLVVARMCM